MKFLVLIAFSCLSICFVTGRDFGVPQKPYLEIIGVKDSKINDKAFVERFTSFPEEFKREVLSFFAVNELFDFMHTEEFSAYHHLAYAQYGDSYSNTPVYIKDLKQSDFAYDDGVISFGSIPTFKKYLQTFNKQIKNLKIEVRLLQADELNDVLSTVAEHCAETLTRLEIRSSSSKGINIIKTMSFPMVEELSFFMCGLGEQNLDLKQTFPNVRRLAATFTKSVDRMWIDKNFSNLTHLQVDVDETHAFTESEILRFLRNNPEMHSLSIVAATPKLLCAINNKFPNIVNLGMINLAPEWYKSEMVHMEHIERFVFEGSIKPNPSFVTFNKLKEIQWHSPAEAKVLLLDLIHENSNTLEKILITQPDISGEQLATMTNMLQLERISLSFTTATANQIYDLFKVNQKLSEVRMYDSTHSLRQNLYRGLTAHDDFFGTVYTYENYVSVARNRRPKEKLANPIEFLWDNFF